MTLTRKLPLLVALLLISPFLNAQDDMMDMLEDEVKEEQKGRKVYATFKGIKLINANTTKTTDKHVLEFQIAHRFGNVGSGSGGGVHTLYGFDNATNIRYSLDYGITEELQIGIGRSKTKEHVDGNIKYRFLTQTEDNSIPVSVAFYSCASYTPRIDPDSLYQKRAHRLSYTNQLIVARKFGEFLSFEVLPTMTHRNIVRNYVNENGEAEENTIFSLGFGGRVKLNQRLAIVFDYFHLFSKYRSAHTNSLHYIFGGDVFPDNSVRAADKDFSSGQDRKYYPPLGIGVELETGGHVFHINFTNSAGILANDFIPYTTDAWALGGFKFGFSISRVFHLR